MFCRLMLGRLRKLACGVGPGVGTGVVGLSWLATFWTVLNSVLAAAFSSPPEPLRSSHQPFALPSLISQLVCTWEASTS